jgi:hypothetical protein
MNAATSQTWSGLTVAGVNYRAAYVSDGNSCSNVAHRVSVVSLPDGTNPSSSFSIASAGTYKPCLSIDGGVSWGEQSALSVSVGLCSFAFASRLDLHCVFR